MVTSSSTHLIPEMSGSSHSSKKTRGRVGNCAEAARIPSSSCSSRVASWSACVLTTNHSAEHPDHRQNLCHRSLVEGHDRNAAPDQLRGEIGLKVRESQDEVRIQRLNLVELRADERRHAWLLTRFGRTHRIARDADDAMALTEEVQRFSRFFGQTDDALRIGCGRHGRLDIWQLATCQPPDYPTAWSSGQFVDVAGIAMLLADQLRRIGAGLRTELLHASVEHLGEVQVAVLIDGDRVRPVELSGLSARTAPPVQVLSVQVVLEDAVRAAVRNPQVLIRGDDVRVRLMTARRSSTCRGTCRSGRTPGCAGARDRRRRDGRRC